MLLPQLRRVRWAVRATLVLGVAASVVANVLHAQDNPISQAIAAWPPLALLLTVELISRVPVHRRYLAAARLCATATITGIAAWVSYWHMAAVAARYGETGASPYLLPLSVDGLIVVASICLVELGGRISAVEAQQAEAVAGMSTVAAVPAASPGRTHALEIPAPAAQAPAPQAPAAQAPAPQAAVPITVAVPFSPLPTAGSPAAPGLPEFSPSVTRRGPATGKSPARPAAGSAAQPGTGSAKSSTAKQPAARTGARPQVTAAHEPPRAPRPRRSVTETVTLAERIRAARPDATEADVAAELGISTSRLRSARREAAQIQAAQVQKSQLAADRLPVDKPGADEAEAGRASPEVVPPQLSPVSADLRLAA